MTNASTLAVDGGAPVRERPWNTERGLGALGEEEATAVDEVLRSRSLFRYYGPDLLGRAEQLEARLREFTASPYALAVSSGTAALQAAMIGLSIEEGDEVIVPAITFIATVAAVVQMRAVPVFADVDESLNLDPASVAANLTDKTRLVIPVHLAEVAADMDALASVLSGTGVRTLEDAAQAVGTTYKGRAAGTVGDAGIYSFQLQKNMTSGEGGAVLTADWDVHDRASRYQDQGGQFTTFTGESRHTSGEAFVGTNLRITELQAAIADVQLGRLAAQVDAARTRARQIREGLDGLAVRWRAMPDEEGEGGSVMFFCADRPASLRVIEALRAEGVPAGQMYGGRPVYMNPAVLARRAPWSVGCPWNCAVHPTTRTYHPGLCPRAENLLGRSVLVGVGPHMDDGDTRDAITAMRKVLGALL